MSVVFLTGHSSSKITSLAGSCYGTTGCLGYSTRTEDHKPTVLTRDMSRTKTSSRHSCSSTCSASFDHALRPSRYLNRFPNATLLHRTVSRQSSSGMPPYAPDAKTLTTPAMRTGIIVGHSGKPSLLRRPFSVLGHLSIVDPVI